MNKRLITKVLAAGVTTSAVLAAIVVGAGSAGAATIAASTPQAAAQAKPSAVASPDEELAVGPVASFSTYQACVLYGALEFPPGEPFEGGTIVETECLEGVPVPPATGAWDLFVIIETGSCDAATPADPASGPVITVKS
jgi:hypothetical protein